MSADCLNNFWCLEMKKSHTIFYQRKWEWSVSCTHHFTILYGGACTRYSFIYLYIIWCSRNEGIGKPFIVIPFFFPFSHIIIIAEGFLPLFLIICIAIPNRSILPYFYNISDLYCSIPPMQWDNKCGIFHLCAITWIVLEGVHSGGKTFVSRRRIVSLTVK